jgi:CRP/FNR family transcriptional regulator, cyclic AMP receptor protein
VSPDGQRLADLGSFKWPDDLARRRPESSALYAYVLDSDDDLADEFDIRTRLAARQVATARVIEAAVGECDLGGWFEAVGAGFGLLILDGLVAYETRVGDRTALELVGSGDLLQPPDRSNDELLERADSWRALSPTRLALLDEEFANRVRPWPQVVHVLLRRSGARTASVDALRAISCQPRLEVRLVLLLWHLAARWGRVEPTGVRLSLPLTHRLLGRLAAAERPSISHALHRLAHAGLVTGSADDLHLRGTLDDELEVLIERASPIVPGHAPDALPAPRRIA